MKLNLKQIIDGTRILNIDAIGVITNIDDKKELDNLNELTIIDEFNQNLIKILLSKSIDVKIG